MTKGNNHGYSDQEQLELFLECVQELKNNSLIQQEKLKRVSFLSKYDEKLGHWYELLDVNNDPLNLESFNFLIMTFRLMYMDGEPTNIRTIRNIVRQYTPMDRLEWVDNFGRKWNNALQEESHIVNEEGGFLKLDKVLDNWFYGKRFHSDKEKRDFVKHWGKPLEAEVVFIINYLCVLVFDLGDFVVQALEEKWLEIPSTDESTGE